MVVLPWFITYLGNIIWRDQPAGFKEAPMSPAAAYYSKELSIFILPYEAVRASENPAGDLTAFLTATYDAGARLARWDRTELERR